MNRILTLTLNPSIDVTAAVAELKPEQKLRCSKAHYEPGGGGLNVSRVIRELGGTSLAFVRAGGPTGDWLKAMLEAEGITPCVHDAGGPTRPSFQITEQATGRMYRFVLPGPELGVAAARRLTTAVRKLIEETEPGFVVASGSLPPGTPQDFLPRLAALCRKRQTRLIADTSGPALASLIGAGVYLIKPNREEIEALRRLLPNVKGPPESVAKALVRNKTATAVVVTLGAEGAILVTEEGAQHLTSPPVEARSAVGAGDSFVGALTLALDRGADLEEACRYGIAAGAAAVMTPGTELCRKRDVEAIFRRMGGRSP